MRARCALLLRGARQGAVGAIGATGAGLDSPQAGCDVVAMGDLLPLVRTFQARERRAAAAIAARDEERRRRLPDVAALLSDEFGATEVIVFGSLVVGDPHAGSDVDLAVRGIPAGRYLEALARVSDLLGCDVDLVELESARPSLRECIAATGVELTHG